MTEFAPKFSIIIPAYNEELRLPSTLDSVCSYFEARGVAHEILIVDDGSTDKTTEIVRTFSSTHSAVRLISYTPNKGKGNAVRHGMLESKGEFLLYNDADGSSPITEIERLEKAMDDGADVAIGSRACLSDQTEVKTVWYRKIIGRVFAALVNLLIVPGIADTQCGFKMFRRETAQYLFRRQRSERFSFDVELLFLARKAGYCIAEVPINWTNCPGSKVNLIVDSMDMFLDILKIRFAYLTGAYREERRETATSSI